MEKHMLVLVLDPKDPQIFDIRQPAAGEPIFGIVVEASGLPELYVERPATVKYDNTTTEIFPQGRVVPLLVLPEEDATNLTPKQAFSKWAAEIVRKQGLVHLPEAQRDFLKDTFDLKDPRFGLFLNPFTERV